MKTKNSLESSRNWSKNRTANARIAAVDAGDTITARPGPAQGPPPDSAAGAGTLYVVATPIGNLGDLSVRALETLKTVDLIASEDTRHSGNLLHHFGVTTPQTPYHDFNKERVAGQLLSRLRAGRSIALVSDAGTPGIADPAYLLVRLSIENGIRVTPIPGPCAAISALVASGLPTDRFIFENFPPRKRGKRLSLLAGLRGERRSVIFYESPYRIVALLQDIRAVFGNMPVVVGREITKTFEEFLRMNADELLTHFERHPPKGECVVMFNPRYCEKAEDEVTVEEAEEGEA